MYWFYIVKGFRDSEDEFIEGLETVNLHDDVIIADNRDEAKKIIEGIYGKLPYRKPRKFDLETRYVYLTESNEYWFNRNHLEVDIVCNMCMKEVKIVGIKNVKYYKEREYCSVECREEAKTQNINEFVDKSDHLGINNYSNVVGYIYKITNKRTMKSYIGQTIHPPIFRWWNHLKEGNKFDQEDVSELLFEVLEVVSYSENNKEDEVYVNEKDKLTKRESYYVKLYDSIVEGYNKIMPR